MVDIGALTINGTKFDPKLLPANLIKMIGYVGTVANMAWGHIDVHTDYVAHKNFGGGHTDLHTDIGPKADNYSLNPVQGYLPVPAYN